MNYPSQFCSMNYSNKHQNKLKSAKYVLLTGLLLSLAVFVLQYFKVIGPNLELTLAPLLVIVFLAFGENLLALLLMYSMQVFSKLKK